MKSTELLREVQQGLRSPERDREELIDELLVLAKVIARDPTQLDGMTRAALGGMHYCLTSLFTLANVGGSQSLDEIADQYASVELKSFPVSQEDRDNTYAKVREDRIVARRSSVVTSDGVERFVYSSHLDQTTQDGKVMSEGELIHNVSRFPPPWRDLLPRESGD